MEKEKIMKELYRNFAKLMKKFVKIKLTSRSTRKILAMSIFGWIIFCSLMVVTTYNSHDIIDPSNIERAEYGDRESQDVDRIEFNVSKFIDDKFFGTIKVTLKSKKAKDAYAKSHKVNVIIQGVHIGNVFDVPNWISVTETEKLSDAIILKSKVSQQFYKSGLIFSFPFDRYHLEIAPKIQFYMNKGFPVEIIPKYGTALVKLNDTFRIESLKKIPNMNCEYSDCKNEYIGDIGEKEFYFLIQRQPWYRWLVLGVLGFLFVPVLLMAGAKISNINIDMIAVLISLATIRSYMFGVTTSIFYLDFIFGLILMLVATFTLYKIFRS